MTAAFTLPPRLDLEAVAGLADNLLSMAGQDVEIDASQVTHLGTLCLQVLLAAARDQAIAGKTLQLSAPSPAFLSQLALFGLTPNSLERGIT